MPAPVWVILPTYNEAENLERVVAAGLAAVPDAHILVVDDSSPDGTGAIADALDGVEVQHRPRKSGLGRAYVAGFARALEASAASVEEMDVPALRLGRHADSREPADVPMT